MIKLSDERLNEICNGKAVIGTYLEFEKMASELLLTRAELASLREAVRWINEPETMIVKADGDSWCYVLPNFKDLVVSPSVFTDNEPVTDESGRLDYIYTVLTGEVVPPLPAVEGDNNG